MQLFIGNEIDSDAILLFICLLDQESKVNKTLLVSLSYFYQFWWITDGIQLSVLWKCAFDMD